MFKLETHSADVMFTSTYLHIFLYTSQMFNIFTYQVHVYPQLSSSVHCIRFKEILCIEGFGWRYSGAIWSSLPAFSSASGGRLSAVPNMFLRASRAAISSAMDTVSPGAEKHKKYIIR